MRIATIIGARPQFIKAAMGSPQIRKNHDEIIIHTGQHYDKEMSETFFRELCIPRPDYNLGISGGTHAKMTAMMMEKIEPILIREKIDAVLLYGDTNSTLAGAITAAKMYLPVFHMEAGNRMGSVDNPEEINRVITDHVSSMNLCATTNALDNLKHEGRGNVSFFVGNIMYDAFLKYSSEEYKEARFFNLEGERVVIPDNYYYLTCHREENTKEITALKEILYAMNTLGSTVVYPVHPRCRESVLEICQQQDLSNIYLLKPVGYRESIELVKNAKMIVTDSGGLQCEAFFAKKKCVSIGEKAIWPETMVGNRNQLSKANRDDILEKLSKDQIIDPQYNPFGNGHAAEKMSELINTWCERNII